MKVLATGLVLLAVLYGVVSAVPSSADFQEHIKTAATLMEANEYLRAVAELKAALAINPYSVVAHDNLGIAYSKLGQYEAAIDEFKSALEINSALSITHNNLGYIYLEQKRYEAAKAEFEEALKIDPRNDAAHNNLGRAYLELGAADKAVSEIRKALELNPKNNDARNNLNRLEKRIGMAGTTTSHAGTIEASGTTPDFKIITSRPSENLSDKSGAPYYRIGPTASCAIEFNHRVAKRFVFKAWVREPKCTARVYWSFLPEGLEIGNKELAITEDAQPNAKTPTSLRPAGEINIPIPQGARALFLSASHLIYISDLALETAGAESH
jgi:tetratricopeptide (TPR) repeat protein